MRAIFLALASVAASAAAQAETVPAPNLALNDCWTYQQTVEDRTGWHQSRVEFSVTRTGSPLIALSSKPVDSTMPATDSLGRSDWSRYRSVNGHDTLVNRPFAFPMSTGKSWQVEYSEDHPNRAHSSEHFKTEFKVVGWEDVTVPAGTFHALKVEGNGEWQAAIAPAVQAAAGARTDGQGSTFVMQNNRITATTVSGRTYKAFWYVPGVKRWVKTTEEYYDSNGIRNERFGDELESYKVAQ